MACELYKFRPLYIGGVEPDPSAIIVTKEPNSENWKGEWTWPKNKRKSVNKESWHPRETHTQWSSSWVCLLMRACRHVHLLLLDFHALRGNVFLTHDLQAGRALRGFGGLHTDSFPFFLTASFLIPFFPFFLLLKTCTSWLISSQLLIFTTFLPFLKCPFPHWDGWFWF